MITQGQPAIRGARSRQDLENTTFNNALNTIRGTSSKKREPLRPLTNPPRNRSQEKTSQAKLSMAQQAAFTKAAKQLREMR